MYIIETLKTPWEEMRRAFNYHHTARCQTRAVSARCLRKIRTLSHSPHRLASVSGQVARDGKNPQLPKVGRHRRGARVAVLKYKRTRDALRKSALKELAAFSQRHRLGY